MSTSASQTGWQSVGDLELLLDAGSMQELLRSADLPVERAVCNYIRLKPGIGALLGLELELRSPDGERETLAGYIRTHPADRAAQLIEKWHSGRTAATAFGEGVRLLPGGKSVLFLFPNDTRLRGLRYISEKQKLKRLLSRLEHVGGDGWRIRGRKSEMQIVRYKPERRLILRGDLRLKNDETGERRERQVFLRFFTDGRGRRIASLCRSLFSRAADQGSADIRVPRPLGTMLGGRLLVEEAVAGEEILPAVRTGGADPAALATAISTLHTVEAPKLPVLILEDVLRGAEQTADNLLHVDPDLRQLVDPILERLRASIPAESSVATLHGDCHLHQFLGTDDGPVLVDFERAVRGHPLYDLGHLSAHLEVLAGREPEAAQGFLGFREALVGDYARSNPDVAMESLPFFTACGLLEHALLAFRNQEPRWADRCREILQLTLSLAPAESPGTRARRSFFSTSDTPNWDVFYPRAKGDWPGLVGGGGQARTYGIYDVNQDRFRECAPEQDRKLPGLAEWMCRGTLVSYRVGRRATVRVDDAEGQRFVKLVEPRKVGKIAERFALIGDAAGERGASFPETPALLQTDEASGVLVFARMPGTPLHSLLTGEADLDPEMIERAATGLARFHGTPWRRDPRPAQASHFDPGECAGFLRGHDPQLEEQSAAVLAELRPLPTGPFGPTDRLVHGDLHDRNLFLTDGIGLLDLDSLGVGDPVEDVGNLIGHFVLRALQSGRSVETGRAQAHEFLETYSKHGDHPPRDGIDAVVARTMFRLACLYRFRRQWHHLCAQLLEESLIWAKGKAL